MRNLFAGSILTTATMLAVFSLALTPAAGQGQQKGATKAAPNIILPKAGSPLAPPVASGRRVPVAQAADPQESQSFPAPASVRHSVDQKAACAANSLATIMLEGYRGFALGLKIFIEEIEHLEKGHVGRHPLHLIGGKRTGRLGVQLPPDFECQVHGYL